MLFFCMNRYLLVTCLLQLVYQFSVLAVITYHKYRDLMQHKCITLQLCRLGVLCGSHETKIRVLAGLCSLCFFSFKYLFIWLCWVVHELPSCGAQAQLLCSMWDLSSLTRDGTHIPCIARWILNHWTPREVPEGCVPF